jgi:hypothetical protein
MSVAAFPQTELVRVAKLSPTDLARIQQCRHLHTRMGFAYQLAFMRLAKRFPAHEPLEMVDEIVTYVSVQLDIPSSAIQFYTQQQRTIVNHQQEICDHLQLRRFGESEVAVLEAFLFEEASQLEQTGPLLVRAKSSLQENGILFPADRTLRRLIAGQRQQAREHIFQRVMAELTPELTDKLDALLAASARRRAPRRGRGLGQQAARGWGSRHCRSVPRNYSRLRDAQRPGGLRSGAWRHRTRHRLAA